MPSILTALAVAVTTLTSPATSRAEVPTATSVTVIDRGGFRDAMRKLWEDHVTWTRLYIVSAVAGLPDAGPTAARLLQNQADIGNAIKPFYGDAAGDRLTALLRQHILIAADLVTAAKAGNNTDVQAASARWYSNSDEIADFLSGANPDKWPRAALRAEMRHHLDLTLEEAKARLTANWTADIAAYDAIHQHILGMADMLAAGIISQFPRQFN
jgi:hypothetical protein